MEQPVLQQERAATPHAPAGAGTSSSRTRLLLAVLVALGAFACGAAWSMSSAMGAAPDDNYHQASIWCAADRCAPVPGDPGLVRVPAIVGIPGCYAGNNQVSADCQRALTGDVETAAFDRGGYPGGFYRVMSLFVGDDVGRAVLTMRLVNVLIAVVLFTVLALSGTRHTTRLQLYALTPTLIPLGWFILASVNPSSWAITGVSAYGFAVHSLFVVRRRWKIVVNAVVAGLAAILAISARGDAGVYVVVVTVAVAVLHWRTLRARPKLALVPVACCLLAVYVALGAGQVTDAAGVGAQSDRARIDVVVGFLNEWPQLISGMFGYGLGLGWFDTFVHPITAFPTVMVFGYLTLLGLSRGSRTKTLAVLILGGAMMAFPTWVLWRARLIPGEGVQPRYLLPLMPVLLVLLLTGRKPWRSIQLTRVQAWVVWAMLSAANAGALYVNTQRYVTGFDGPLVMDHVEWWWWSGFPSPTVSCVMGAVGFAVFAAAIIPLSGTRSSASARTAA